MGRAIRSRNSTAAHANGKGGAAISGAVRPKLHDTDEAAEYLRTAPGTLCVWRSTKRYNLPYVKVGGKVYYRENDLADFLSSRVVR